MVKYLSLLVVLASLVILATSVVICPRTPLLSIESARSQSDNVIIDGSYNPDAISKINPGNGNRFSYYFSVYVSISKNYSNAPATIFSAKADAKVQQISEPAK